MNRPALIAAATAALALTVAACGPPKASSVGPLKRCTQAVTTFAWNAKAPCIPVAPQRLDVLFDLRLVSSTTANVRCAQLGGAPIASLPTDPPLTRRCRAVDYTKAI